MAVLSPNLTEEVLTKLGLATRPAVDLKGLASVYHAWCRHVPFDNVRKLIHINAGDPSVLPGDQPAEFFDNWLKYGSGGTCWSGNGALCSLLASLGFETSRGVATMLLVPESPPNHGTVLVSIEGTTYMVDASILHSEPLRLHNNAEATIDNPAWGARAHRRDNKWIITWKHARRPEGFDCRLEHVGATAQEFSERHESTRGWGPMNYAVTLRLIKNNSMIVLLEGARVEFDHAGNFSTEPISHAQRKEFLLNEVGMHEHLVNRLPEDQPTPPPPWAQSS